MWHINRSGRSRHGHPVRGRKKIPSITSRWSFHPCPAAARQYRFQPRPLLMAEIMTS